MGKLFVIGGTDGSGKQTQLEKLKERFEKDGIDYKLVAFQTMIVLHLHL